MAENREGGSTGREMSNHMVGVREGSWLLVTKVGRGRLESRFRCRSIRPKDDGASRGRARKEEL